MKNVSQTEHVNVGVGADISIENLAKKIMKAVGFSGSLTKDLSRPDGTPRKIMDDSQLKGLGWAPSISLEAGLKDTYEWFLEHFTE
jgi:GDP-L-fucose synthase